MGRRQGLRSSSPWAKRVFLSAWADTSSRFQPYQQLRPRAPLSKFQSSEFTKQKLNKTL